MSATKTPGRGCGLAKMTRVYLFVNAHFELNSCF